MTIILKKKNLYLIMMNFFFLLLLTGNLPKAIANLDKTIAFPRKVTEISFQQTGIKCKVTISQFVKPFFNIVQVALSELDEKYDINFYNSVHTKRNNLFQSSDKYKCWLHSPQVKEVHNVIY